jgi:hypothetical protein
MANREACELYIEQEIKAGLERGEKPYSIGKDLSAWVEKIFEVNIKPKTLIKRAERLQEGLTTNVVKKSQPLETIKDSTPEIIKDRHPQGGGAREGAGRPPQITSSAKPEPTKSRYRRLSAPLDPADKLRIQNESIYEVSFKKAFDEFYFEVQNAKLENWEKTTKEAALHNVKLLYDLITI